MEQRRSSLSSKTRTGLREALRKFRRRARDRNRSSRHHSTSLTLDEVLQDPSTCRPLYQFIKRNGLVRICAVISTGKASNVYCVSGRSTGNGLEDRNEEAGGEHGGSRHTAQEEASSKPWRFCAMKVYKTSIRDFQDAAKPVHGYHRADRTHRRMKNRGRMGISRISKEFHTLLKLHAAGIPCPLPLDVSPYALLMSLAGVCTPRCMQPTRGTKAFAPEKPSLPPAHKENTFSPAPVRLHEEVNLEFCYSPFSSFSSSSTCCSPSPRRKSDEADTPHDVHSPSECPGEALFDDEVEEEQDTKKRKKPPWKCTVAPRLRDLDTSKTSACCAAKARALYHAWCRLYVQAIASLRWMYQECRLVHGHFSEYSLLYYCQGLYVIDVGQAVDIAHPEALDFLRRDCRNVTSFFSTQINHAKAQVLSHRRRLREEYGERQKKYNNYPRLSSFPLRQVFSFPSPPCRQCLSSLARTDTLDASPEFSKNRHKRGSEALAILTAGDQGGGAGGGMRPWSARHRGREVGEREKKECFAKFGWKEDDEGKTSDEDEEEEEASEEHQGWPCKLRLLSVSGLLELLVSPDLPEALLLWLDKLQEREQRQKRNQETGGRKGGREAKGDELKRQDTQHEEEKEEVLGKDQRGKDVVDRPHTRHARSASHSTVGRKKSFFDSFVRITPKRERKDYGRHPHGAVSMFEAVKEASTRAHSTHSKRKRTLSLLAEAIGRWLEGELPRSLHSAEDARRNFLSVNVYGDSSPSDCSWRTPPEFREDGEEGNRVHHDGDENGGDSEEGEDLRSFKKNVDEREKRSSGRAREDSHVFRGRIPEGIARKEWKKLVKKHNRKRRRRQYRRDELGCSEPKKEQHQSARLSEEKKTCSSRPSLQPL